MSEPTDELTNLLERAMKVRENVRRLTAELAEYQAEADEIYRQLLDAGRLTRSLHEAN